MSTKFPTPQERAMQWLLEATEIGGMSRPEPRAGPRTRKS